MSDEATFGGGPYDAECTRAREDCGAEGVVLIISNGKKGNGFEVQLDRESLLALPHVLREIAAAVERRLPP